MTNKVRYPKARATALAADLQRRVTESHPELVVGRNPKDEPVLREYCRRHGIHVVKKDVPGGKRAVTLDVAGSPFVVLAPGLRDDRSFVMAHEISHIVLGHIGKYNFKACGYSEATQANGMLLQEVYCTDQELSADLLGMHIIMPDDYLHHVVDENIYIPAGKLADKHGLSVQLVAGRIELYRRTHGYARSEAARLRREGSNPLSMREREEGRTVELMSRNALENYLPMIDEQLAKLLT